MKAYANWQTVWEFSGYRVVADISGLYVVWTAQGPLVSFRGRNGLRQAYETARLLAGGEVAYG